jgi:hypothetical protein
VGREPLGRGRKKCTVSYCTSTTYIEFHKKNYLYRGKEYKNGIWAARQFYNII